ncbi:helix-turn-helix domain-containing protein [Candidatus Woesearchaeota archaeon]|nr:helix-turn-helix domain-containing protein [Candidatus Woesearchaeota archaeon]
MQVPAKHPQEIEVWYVLPAVRRELVRALKKDGLSQKKIAEILNVTESAISQYLSEKRGKTADLPKEVIDFIDKSALKIKDKTTAYRQIQEICTYIKESKALCKIHAGYEEGLDACDICYIQKS